MSSTAEPGLEEELHRIDLLFKKNGYSNKTIKEAMGNNGGRPHRLAIDYKRTVIVPYS